MYTTHPITAGFPCLPVVLCSLCHHGSAQGNIVSIDVNGIFVIGISVYPEEEISEDVESSSKAKHAVQYIAPGVVDVAGIYGIIDDLCYTFPYYRGRK